MMIRASSIACSITIPLASSRTLSIKGIATESAIVAAKPNDDMAAFTASPTCNQCVSITVLITRAIPNPKTDNQYFRR